jgi:hypothetical protein
VKLAYLTVKPLEDSTKRRVSAEPRSLPIVADGHARLARALTDRLEQALLRKYREELSKAGFFQRISIRYRIWREVQRDVRKLAPPYALYGSRFCAGTSVSAIRHFHFHARPEFNRST